MRKLFCVFILFIFYSTFLFAGFVPKQDAKVVAKNHFYQSLLSFDNSKNLSLDKISLQCIINPETDKSFNYYVFNVNGDNGYIVVSSSSYIKPVLAYSFESGFNVGNIAPGQQLFLDYYNEAISTSLEDVNQNSTTHPEWIELKNFNEDLKVKQKETVGPLLVGINWNQTWPYNAGLPTASGGSGGHVVVGCVATAMLTVMKYYNWPPSGEGSYFHSSWANGGHGNHTVNFGNATYNWENIPLTASGQYNEELAKVNYHAGVAVRMWWSANGSGSQTSHIVNALESYFKYSPDVKLRSRTNFNNAQWKNMIKAQVDAKKPIVYSGSPSEGAGHAWNCDGYQGDDHFHMNWGWGGAGNGFYTLDNLNSSATPGGEENNFIYSNQIVIDIYPRENYPSFCSGSRLITGTEGSFDDGSSTSQYLPNSNCTYIINPECGSIVSVEFYKFDLAQGDYIEIYDGEGYDLLIETFDEDNLPDASQTRSTRGAMTIKFRSNAGAVAGGWGMSYTVDNCRTNIIYTEPEGSFDDGSGICNYSSGTVCSWRIEPEGVNYIEIDFEKFDLATGADAVSIYRNTMSGSNLIASFSASNPPEDPVYVNAEVAIIQFFAGSSSAGGEGWEISYTSGVSNIEQTNILGDLTIFPNPGDNASEIIFDSEKNTNASFSIYSLLGELVAQNQINVVTGSNNIKISDIANNKLDSGVYFVNIEVENNIFTEKFVILK